MNDRPMEDSVVLASGVEDGVQWCVCAAPLPAANGYVRIPDGHSLSNVDAESVLDAPGGITWGRDDWIGFDTLHYGDVWSDEEIARLMDLGAQWRTTDRLSRPLSDWATTWTLELVIQEAKKLARQVAGYEQVIESIKAAGRNES